MTEIKESGGSERVTMVWPRALKERVRMLAGVRGITAFTLEAVQTKLNTQYGVKVLQPTPDDREALSVGPLETTVPTAQPVRLEEAAAQPLPHDRYAQESEDPEERERVEGNVAILDTPLASGLVVTAATAATRMCPVCGQELVDGDCWTFGCS